jgi:HSP20 family protein
MDLIRRTPNRNVAAPRGFQDEMSRMLDNFMCPAVMDPFESAAPENVFEGWTPKVDMSEDDNNYHINMELPGLTKDDIDVTVENGLLNVEGERKHESEQGGENKDFHRVERFYGQFQRSFRLPEGVNDKDINAEFKNGILHLQVPKGEEAKPKQIEVSVN